MNKPSYSELKHLLTTERKKLKATKAFVRILKKQNERMASVNEQLIRELHEFAMKYGEA